MIVCRPCKSAWRRRHCSIRLFWTLLPPCLLERGARDSDGTANRAAITHGPERARDTPSARGRTTLPRRDSKTRARGPGRGQGRTTLTNWFRSQGISDWALETRLVERACQSNSQGNAKLARKRAGSEFEDLRLECENRTAASPLKHPDEIFRCAVGAGLFIVFHYVDWVHRLGNRRRRRRSS